MTSAAKEKFDTSVNDYKNSILQSVSENAKKNTDGDIIEITLQDIEFAVKQSPNQRGRPRAYRMIVVIYGIIGIAIIIFGVGFVLSRYFYRDVTLVMELELFVIISSGLIFIYAGQIADFLRESTIRSPERRQQQTSNLLKHWEEIELLVDEIGQESQKNYNADKPMTLRLEALRKSSGLTTPLYLKVRDLLLARNSIVHNHSDFANSDLVDLILKSQQTIDELSRLLKKPGRGKRLNSAEREIPTTKARNKVK